jgi:DNA replication protein DnaC
MSGDLLPEEECPLCHGYGLVIDRATNTHRPCSCGLLDRVAMEERFRAAGIPARFLKKDFDSFKPLDKQDKEREMIRKAARSYALSFRPDESPGLLFRGNPGSGKTHIAIAVLREIIRRGFTGRFENFSDLLSRIRSTWHRDAEMQEESLLAEVEEADLLVIDDLGAESTADWVRDRLYLIINRRYEAARPLIITTNCAEADLRARVGDRIYSRLCEMCAASFPGFPTVDYRQAKMQ